jgi:hypothetical protein
MYDDERRDSARLASERDQKETLRFFKLPDRSQKQLPDVPDVRDLPFSNPCQNPAICTSLSEQDIGVSVSRNLFRVQRGWLRVY